MALFGANNAVFVEKSIFGDSLMGVSVIKISRHRSENVRTCIVILLPAAKMHFLLPTILPGACPALVWFVRLLLDFHGLLVDKIH